MLVGISLFDPGTLIGALGPLFILTAVCVAAWAYARLNIQKAQEIAITTWKENAAAADAKADRLEIAYNEQRDIKHELQAELAAERMKTDQTIVLEELGQFHKEFAARGEVFNGILRELAAQRASGVSEITVELRAMEARLVAVMEHQTAALNLIASKIANGGELHSTAVSRGATGATGATGQTGPSS